MHSSRHNPPSHRVRKSIESAFSGGSMKKAVCLAFAAFLAASTAFAQGDKAVSGALMKKENDLLAAVQKKDWATFKKPIMAGAWSVDEGGYMTVDDMIKMMNDPKANFM